MRRGKFGNVSAKDFRSDFRFEERNNCVVFFEGEKIATEERETKMFAINASKSVELVRSLASDARDFVMDHPYSFAALGLIVGTPLIIHVYCRSTVGMCDCKTDMAGKTVIITGANTGIGKETALELARRKAKVILACRNKERGQRAVMEIAAVTGNPNVSLKILDLCSFESVRSFAEDIIKTEKKVDVLINNAGIIANEPRMVTRDGCDLTMQSNYLGHFLLSNLLVDVLKKEAPSRIINLTSFAYKMEELYPDDPNFTKSNDPNKTYYNSKFAMVLFTRALADKLFGTAITVNAVHPGIVKTEIFKQESSLAALIGKALISLCGKTPLEGSQTTLHVAICPYLTSTTGRYFSDCREVPLSPRAMDQEAAMRLWQSSAAIVNLSSD